MKPGTTYAYMARLFLRGNTMQRIALICRCELLYVERAIWAVMVREEKKRK